MPHLSKAVEFIVKWGNAASVTLLDADCHHYSTPEVEGIIGYRLVSGCAVVFGDPVCSLENRSELAHSFHAFCKQKGWRIVYMTASKSFAAWSMNRICHSLLEIGEELILDPFINPKSGVKGRSLRNKLNLATRARLRVAEYKGSDPDLEIQLAEVGNAWLRNRSGPQIFFGQMRIFSEREGKRWFYAQQEGKYVGLLILQHMQTRQGWLVQFLMKTPDAPLGTSELLIAETLTALRREGCRLLSFGVSQNPQIGEIQGLNPATTWFVRAAFKLAQKMFRLDRRRRYWRKFQPSGEPSYLLFSERGIGLREVRSLIRALNVSL